MKKSPTNLIAAKRIAVAVATVFATMSVPAFAADDLKGLMDLLLKKGVITQQEYDANVQAAQDAAENKAFKEKRIDQDVSKANQYVEKHAKDGSVKPSGLGFVSADGKNEINLTGRVHFDSRMFDNNFGTTADRDSGSMGDRFQARRARIGVTGILNKDISYELITNLVGSNANLVDTAWMKYGFDSAFNISMGKMKQPFGMETLTSSNNIDFMERSYLDQMAPGKQLGAMISGSLADDAYTYGVSVYQTGMDPSSNQNNVGPEAGGRLTANLAKVMNLGADTIVHFGAAGTSGKSQVVPTTSSQNGSFFETKGAFVSFRDENNGLNNVYRNRIYGTPPCGTNSAFSGCAIGAFSAAASEAATVTKEMAGLEFAVASGPFKFQAEGAVADFNATSHAFSRTKQNADGTPFTALSGHKQIDVNGSNFIDVVTATGVTTTGKYVYTAYDAQSKGTAKTSYMQAVFNLTGESWAGTYKNGVFGSIKPNSPFSFKNMSGTGAWQVAVRYSKYDASDFGAVVGGAETKITSGGNNMNALEGSPKGNTITYGLTWIPNANARVMLNYSMSKFDSSFFPVDVGTSTSASSLGNKENVISLRTQFNF